MFEQSYQAIKRAIIEGRYTPGFVLSERLLSAQLNMSRTPIRQALQRLAQEGLVVRGPQGAYQIADISLEELEEVFLIREYLERLAVRLAAVRMPPAEVEDLMHRFDRLVEELRQGNRINEFDFDVELHRAFLQQSGSTKLIQMVENLNAHIHRVRILSNAIPERVEETIAEHASILQALAARDPDRAEEAVKHHMRKSASAVREAYKILRQRWGELG